MSVSDRKGLSEFIRKQKMWQLFKREPCLRSLNRIFSCMLRYSLFYVFANQKGLKSICEVIFQIHACILVERNANNFIFNSFVLFLIHPGSLKYVYVFLVYFVPISYIKVKRKQNSHYIFLFLSNG